MKKAVFLVLLLFVGYESLVYGEVNTDIYVRTLRVDKVFIHDLGYAVLYYKPSGGFGMFFIPYSWFTKSGGAGELIWGRDKSYPYLSIFWVNGKFTRLKLYVQENMTHLSWANLYASHEKVKDKFNVTPETIKLEL